MLRNEHERRFPLMAQPKYECMNYVPIIIMCEVKCDEIELKINKSRHTIQPGQMSTTVHTAPAFFFRQLI